MDDLNDRLRQARRRTAARSEVRAALQRLNAAEARDVLLEVLAEFEGEVPLKVVAPASVPPNAKPAEETPGAAERVRPARRQLPKTPDERNRLLLALLQQQPGMPITNLAAHLWGKRDERTLAAVRTRLNVLRTKNVVERFGRGEWRLVRPEGGDGESEDSS